MDLQRCYNASEDTFPLPPHIKERYGPFGFPAPVDASRPYITSNFVMGIDGKASFRELKGRTDGKTVSRSREDRWLMDFLRAHHDGQLIGASTLRDELNPEGQGWDYGIDDEELTDISTRYSRARLAESPRSQRFGKHRSHASHLQFSAS